MSYKLPPVSHGVFMTLQSLHYSGSTTTATSTGYPVLFDTSVDADSGITLLTGTGYQVSGFTVTSSGDYLVTVSAIIDQTTGTNASYEIWFQKNNVDITASNTRVTNDTATAEQVLSVPFIIDLLAGDKFGFKWYCTTSSGYLKYTAAGTRPAVPSIIITVNKISE